MYIRTQICIAWLARLILLSTKNPDVSLLVSFHETLPLEEGPGPPSSYSQQDRCTGFRKIMQSLFKQKQEACSLT